MLHKNLHSLKILEQKRQALRKRATPAEKFLWKHLKTRQVENMKFRRQHSVRFFILDFYCIKYNLCIELDGAYHFFPEQQEYDRLRTKYLESKFITVLRYENKYVFDNLESVLKDIKDHKATYNYKAL